jgi:phosphohistidine phosphatase
MSTLMLLRHAKSDWSDDGQADMDRPLNSRGESAAKVMGRYMADNALVPDVVLCSPARRAMQTWEIAAKQVSSPPATRVEPDIYNFGDGQMLLQCLRTGAGKARSILIVGHNPSIENLANMLVGQGDSKLRAQMSEKYPTATLAVITFSIDDWKALTEGTGTLQRFVRPKDLEN